MSRARPRQALRSIGTIDVTPLVDLTFLLLIVFMITAPVLEHALEVTPPTLAATPPEPKPHKLLTLDRHGQLRVDGQTLAPAALPGWLGERPLAKDLHFFVRADERRPYGEVMGIMRVLREQGFTDVSLVTTAPTD